VTGDRPDTAHVLAPPPVLFLGALVLGGVLQWLWPLPGFAGRLPLRVVGGALIVLGLALSAAVVRHFARAKTPVTPLKETERLVVSGPYRFSRNPDYLGQTLLAAGLALVLALPWALLALIPTLLLVRYGVIAREERYLERRFGEEYRALCRRVRRWL
jgi:protein-S-isoprenylcysteine O-methyltransferase Ste14